MLADFEKFHDPTHAADGDWAIRMSCSWRRHPPGGPWQSRNEGAPLYREPVAAPAGFQSW